MDKNHRALDASPEPAPDAYPADTLLWGALPHLRLNIAQTADLCGISVRQLGYWTKQGYVAASGQGARRMYGLDSLRHVLAIKSAMTSGMSLRQALKVLPQVTDLSTVPPFSTGGAAPQADPPAVRPAPTPRSAQERDELTAALLSLYAANRHTRDDASGLAVKVGRAPADVRETAEALCRHGVLSKTVAQDSVVFESARKGDA